MSMYNKIVGHEDVIEQLKKAIQLGRVSHSYILQGEDGSGKNMIAQAFAEALLCEKNLDEGCGICHSCKQIKSQENPDLIRIGHEKTTSISVDDIRTQLIQDIQIKPYSGKYKIYIIDDAEKMTTQAQNAILKTIEEPPLYSVIILLTNNLQVFLPTILSRCNIIKLKPLEDGMIVKYLIHNFEILETEATVYASFSQGRLGKAIEFLKSEDFSKMKEEVVNMVKNIYAYDISEVLNQVHKIAEFKESINEYIDLLEVWFRDVLLFKATKDPNNIIFKEEINIIKKQASKSSYEGIEIILQALTTTKSRLKANVNFDLAIELMLLNIKEN